MLSDTSAQVDVPVTGQHFINDALWEVRGTYDLKFTLDETWRISEHTLHVLQEIGSRDVISRL